MSDPTDAFDRIFPSPLPRRVRDDACAVLLPVVERAIAAQVGDPAVEYAGIALVQALDLYDAARQTPLRAYVIARAPLIARDERRKFEGREGTRKRKARDRTVAIADFDQARAHAPDADRQQREQVVAVIGRIQRMDGPLRLVALGRVLAEAHPRDIAGMLDVGCATVKDQLGVVRRLLRPDERDHALRLQPAAGAA